MYRVDFIFESRGRDARFDELNARIDAVARATEGFRGSESWRSADGERANASYYWDSLDELRRFASHPDHAEAKREYARWYRGYHVVVSQVLRAYGDGGLAHVVPDERAARRTGGSVPAAASP